MIRDRTSIWALVVAAFLFGITFVVVKEAVAEFPPLAFVGWRFVIGAGALAVLARPRGSRVWRDGAIAGLFLFAGYAFQTVGLVTTGASNSALITGLYVVFTPFLVAISSRRMPSPWVFVGAVVSFVGLALLTVDETLRLETGDVFTLLCALGFAGHITYLARSAPNHPVIPFTAVQLAVTGALGLGLSTVIEGWTVPTGREWPTIILTGVGVSAIAFLLQVWAQSRIGAGTTAVVLTLEPVFGVGMAALVLGERLTIGGWIGAILIILAIEVVITKGSRIETKEAEAISPAH